MGKSDKGDKPMKHDKKKNTTKTSHGLTQRSSHKKGHEAVFKGKSKRSRILSDESSSNSKGPSRNKMHQHSQNAVGGDTVRKTSQTLNKPYKDSYHGSRDRCFMDVHGKGGQNQLRHSSDYVDCGVRHQDITKPRPERSNNGKLLSCKVADLRTDDRPQNVKSQIVKQDGHTTEDMRSSSREPTEINYNVHQKTRRSSKKDAKKVLKVIHCQKKTTTAQERNHSRSSSRSRSHSRSPARDKDKLSTLLLPAPQDVIVRRGRLQRREVRDREAESPEAAWKDDKPEHWDTECQKQRPVPEGSDGEETTDGEEDGTLTTKCAKAHHLDIKDMPTLDFEAKEADYNKSIEEENEHVYAEISEVVTQPADLSSPTVVKSECKDTNISCNPSTSSVSSSSQLNNAVAKDSSFPIYSRPEYTFKDPCGDEPQSTESPSASGSEENDVISSDSWSSSHKARDGESVSRSLDSSTWSEDECHPLCFCFRCFCKNKTTNANNSY